MRSRISGGRRRNGALELRIMLFVWKTFRGFGSKRGDSEGDWHTVSFEELVVHIHGS